MHTYMYIHKCIYACIFNYMQAGTCVYIYIHTYTSTVYSSTVASAKSSELSMETKQSGFQNRYFMHFYPLHIASRSYYTTCMNDA